MRKKNKNLKNSSNQQVLMPLFCVFLFLIPLFNALLPKEYFYAAMMIEILLVLGIFVKHEKVFLDVKFFIIFAVQWLLSIFNTFIFSVNKEESIYGNFMLLFGFLNFILVQNLIYQDRIKNLPKILWSMVLSGTFISLVNIINAWMDPTNAKNLGRMEILIQYANTQAVFLFICMILSMFLIFEESSTNKRLVLYVAIFFTTTTLILTLSRTMWILATLGIVLYLILNKEQKTIKIIGLILLLSVGMSFLVSMNDKERIQARQGDKRGVSILESRNEKQESQESTNMLRRLSSLSKNATELQERFATYYDAMRIGRDYFFTGIGTGGWESLQYPYQSSLYATKYIHSMPFKLLLEGGIFNLLLFTIQLGFLIRYIYNNRKGDRNKSLMLAISIATGVLLLHSLVDFDFEYPVILSIFYIFAAMASRANYPLNSMEIPKKTIQGMRLVLTGLLLLCLILFTQRVFISWGNAFYRIGEFSKANPYYEAAYQLNPFSAEAYYSSAECIINRKQENISREDETEYLFKIAKTKELSGNTKLCAGSKIKFYSLTQDSEGLVAAYEELIAIQPLVIEYYEALAELLLKKAERDLKSGNSTSGKRSLEKISALESRILSPKRVSPFTYKLKHKPNLRITEKIKAIVDKAKVFSQN